MPLQNRVDPFGAIHAVPERGLFTGNRGIIHDPDTRTLLKKRWALQAWLVCECEFQGRKRVPMGRNRPGGPDGRGTAGWTELFFLDEVTALAAGHRPCFFCRRRQAKDFLARFGAACRIEQPRAPMLDTRLHRERLASGGRLPTIAIGGLDELPDGAMIADDTDAYALCTGQLRRWSFSGYAPAIDSDALRGRPLRILTPRTTLAVLGQGYRPVWHPTAKA
jgi:hypothetical protein